VGGTGGTGGTGAAGAQGCPATQAIDGDTGANTLNASTTEYTSLIATGSDPNSTTTNGNATVHCAGVLSDFSVTTNIDAGGSGDTYTMTVMVNGAASSIGCTITSSSTFCSDGSTEALSVGDVINVRIVPGSSPSSTPVVLSFAALYTASGGNAIGP
jgi:hypothetical protein